jgi:hypothetical protein
MKWINQNRTLVLSNGKTVTFDYEKKDSVELGSVIVVVLEIPRGKVMTENVFGVSSDNGIILWQIERLLETSSDPENRYTGISAFKNNTVRIANWNDTVVDVEATTGKLIGKYFGRFTCKCPPL